MRRGLIAKFVESTSRMRYVSEINWTVDTVSAVEKR